MIIFPVFNFISVIFPCFFLNFPLIILTVSPFLAGTFLLPCFFLNSFDKFTLTSFFLKCIGRFAEYFLCFFGLMLPLQCFENFFILINHRCKFCDRTPAFHDFSCYWSFNLSAFRVSFVVFQNRDSVVFKRDSLA